MKKFFNLFAIVACFTFLAATATNAQNAVRNATNCDFEIVVAYGNVATCTWVGYLQVTVPAQTSINLPIPAGFGIVASKGAYVGSSCVYYIGQPCTPYPSAVGVLCGAPCPDYKAELLSWGIWLHN